MNRTKIEYLDFTWNPIAMRCTPVSEGCAHCWHLRMCDRMAANPAFSPEVRAAYAGKGPPVLVEHRLEEPLHRRKPATIGVQFMGDFLHADIHFEDQLAVLRMIGDCPQHTFVLLTKRTDQLEMWEYACGWHPYPNLWLGVSVENQARADERIPVLLRTPAVVRLISIEPMLGPVDPFDVDGHIAVQMAEANGRELRYPADVVDLVICGAETGPGARVMPMKAAIALRQWCQEAGVPFFFKQVGPHYPYTPLELLVRQWPGEA